jgi:hypothetical protein
MGPIKPSIWSFVIVFAVLSHAYIHASIHQKALRSRQIGTTTQILSRMFGDYDPQTRPPVRDSAEHSAIVVIVSVFINRIEWNDNIATVDLNLRQQFEDSRLAYDVDARESIDEIAIPSTKSIWSPDIYFTNAEELPVSGRKRVIIEPAGFVRVNEQRRVVVSVDDSGSFPFKNSRSLHLRISSFRYTIDDVAFVWANSGPTIVPVETSKELLESPYVFTEANAGDCAGNYTYGVHSCIDAEIIFEGSSSDGFARLFLPALFLVISSWLHFFIHGSWSVPRTFSAAIPFFIFAVIHLFYPRVSYGSCAAKNFLLGCLIFTFFSLIEYFLVIACGVHRKITRYHPLGVGGVRDGSVEPLSTIVTNQPIENEIVEKPTTTKCSRFAGNNGLDLISRIAFPITFLIFLIVFFIWYLI